MIRITPIKQADEQRSVGGEGAGRGLSFGLAAMRAGDGQDRDRIGEAAEQHRDAQGGVRTRACWRSGRRRPSRCSPSPSCRRRGSPTGRAGPWFSSPLSADRQDQRRTAVKPRIDSGRISTASMAYLISRASTFLPRYSGVRPTISPATKTAISAMTSMP